MAAREFTSFNEFCEVQRQSTHDEIAFHQTYWHFQFCGNAKKIQVKYRQEIDRQ
jgi:hypothetical protein